MGFTTFGAARRVLQVLIVAIGLVAANALVGANAVSAVTPAAGQAPASAKKHCTVSAKLVPSCGMWWGVSPGTAHDRRAGTLAFERQLGARVDIYKAYHFSGDLFPNKTERRLALQKGHHRLLDIDYVPDGRYNWAQVAAGLDDAQLVKEARYLKRHFDKRLFISIHHEPEDEVRETPGSGYEAADFAAMFRHVRHVFREQGDRSVVWVFNIMGAQGPDSASWFPDLYPGDTAVDWIAGDPYGCFNAKVCHDFFHSTMNQRFGPNAAWPGFYRWARTAHPHKPIMLSEWGAYANLGGSARLKYLATVRKQLHDFPHLKAIVYWNSNRTWRGRCALVPGTHASTEVGRLARSSVFSQQVP